MGTRINLILFVLFLSVCSLAQQPIKYEAVIKIDTITEEKELLKRLKIWLNEAFIDENEVIQIMDEEGGQIIGKGNINYISKIYIGSAGTNGWISFRMKIQIKIGRYRYEFYDFTHTGTEPFAANFGLVTTDSICPVVIKGSPKSWTQKVWDDIQDQIEYKMQPVISSLETFMMTPTKMETEDW